MIEKQDNLIEIDILFMLKAMWHKIWILILAAAVLCAGGFAYAKFYIKPTYTASSMIYVNNLREKTSKELQESTISGGDLSTAMHLVDTYIVILKTPETLEEVARKSGLSYSAGDLSAMIDATGEEDTEIFTVQASANNPEDAVVLANTVAQVLPERISAVVEGAKVRTVQEALNAGKTGPDEKKFALIGALIGLLLAAAFIVIRELQDDKIYDENYISSVCDDVPVLAVIPDLMDTSAFARNYYYGRGYGYTDENSDKKAKKKTEKSSKGLSDLEKDRLVLCENLDFTASEAYKVLRTNLMFHLNADVEGSKVIGVTSADRSEGKSTTSINLSYVYAQMGFNVMTIEGDLRLPSVAKKMDIEPGQGFTDLVLGNFDKSAIVPSGKYKNWHIITAGSRTANPSEILANDRVGSIMTVLKKKYDIIIVDLPPINEVTDAMAVAPYLDGMVFVVKAQATKKMPFNMALHQLRLAGAPLTGFVLSNSNGGGGKYDKYGKYGNYYNKSKYYKYGYGKNGYGYGYGNGYGYGYGYGEPQGQPFVQPVQPVQQGQPVQQAPQVQQPQGQPLVQPVQSQAQNEQPQRGR